MTILLYLGLFYFHPANQSWISSEHFSIANTLQFVLIDQMLIECVTAFILFWLIRIYARQFRLNEVTPNSAGKLKYFLKFLPLFLVAYFVFAPFTIGLRFLYHYFPTMPYEVYMKEYFFLNAQLYLTYLPPILVMGYGVLGYNLMKLSRHTQVVHLPVAPTPQTYFSRYLDAKDHEGEVLLEVNEIFRFQKIERKYYAINQEGQFVVNKTIQELEESLDPELFVRINRSVIINLNYLKNYAFWENEKYIVRLKDNSEFVMSRNRYNKIKTQLSLKK
ncbi:hypothetical protein BKI52_12845 [marine bacterium AO1-C]|nr:hypothetical protein BKI52_12845 [marine bacterium AO1-C]